MRALVAPMLAFVLALSGCASSQKSAPPTADFTLDEILGRMPPRDTLEARWLSSALLDLGPGAIEQLCGDLDAAGPDRRARAEFALQNVALSSTRPGAEQARLQYVSALAGALERRPSDHAAAFILSQLQIAGGGESIAPASRYLTDPRLCEPAAQAMVAIREGADKAFLAALPGAGRGCRITIIQSLGALKSARAVDALRVEASSDDAAVRRAALEALETIEAPGLATDPARAPASDVAAKPGAERPPAEPAGVPGSALTPDPGSIDSISSVAKSGAGTARLTAIRTLGMVGGEDVQRALIDIAGTSDDDQVVAAAQKSLSAACMQDPDPGTRADALLEAYAGGTRRARLALLPVIGRVGGDRSLALASSELRSADPEFREAAVRALSDWPSIAAYDTLLGVAKGKEKANLRILALRGCVRITEQAPLTPTEAVRYHERTLSAAWRVEEKRQVIGALANVRTPYALQVVAPYVRDDSLGLDAALAAGSIAGGQSGQSNGFGSSQAARAFIDAYVPAKYRERAGRALDMSPSMNTPPPGFRSLFNGKDLDGWKGLVENPVARSSMTPPQLAVAQAKADSNMRAHWSVADGVLLFDGKGESLCTAEEFEDFELFVDWKIEPFGDSGIYLRGSPQVQIWDPVQWPEGSGGLYNNLKNPRKPLECADKPIGQWNTFRIRMIGERVTVHLNGVLVVDSVVLENYWDRTRPIFPSGQIELQSHSSPLQFRNIYIREIPRRKPLFSGSLFNGTDLSGWKVVGGKMESWGARDGVLFTNGEDGGWLSTDREYDNFELELEFRVGQGGNSGVFIRAPHEGDPAYTGMEIQVLDDYADEYVALKPWQYCGSLYGVAAAAKGASRKANEWQHYRIVARGPRVTVTLNGRQVVDADLVRHMDLESTHPGLKRRSGFIGLQCHGDRVEYRNIKLNELEWSENHDGN